MTLQGKAQLNPLCPVSVPRVYLSTDLQLLKKHQYFKNRNDHNAAFLEFTYSVITSDNSSSVWFSQYSR